MTVEHTSRSRADLNNLRRGTTYIATTATGTTVGEYLGMEAPYGARAVLLRDPAGTESINQNEIVSIEPAA
ncbi:MAG: hypothetical protein WBV06_10480 [Acidimicrobiia bacterium]